MARACWAARHVGKLWPYYYSNLPELRALVWAARVLGRRCLDGDFGSRMSAEEEAIIGKGKEIVQRTYQLPPDLKLTPVDDWRAQLETVLGELRAAPAPDGGAEAYASRKHLKRAMQTLVPTLDADHEGCKALHKVMVMPVRHAGSSLNSPSCRKALIRSAQRDYHLLRDLRRNSLFRRCRWRSS